MGDATGEAADRIEALRQAVFDLDLLGGSMSRIDPVTRVTSMAWLIGGVIVLIIFLFSRRAGTVVLVLLGIVWVGLWFSTDRQGQQASDQSLAIVVSSDSELCPSPDMPVSVSLTNHAKKALRSVSFSMIAQQRGSIVYRASHTRDEIIAPGSTFSTCYGLNVLSFAICTVRYDARELDWSGKISLTRFASE